LGWGVVCAGFCGPNGFRYSFPFHQLTEHNMFRIAGTLVKQGA
jgi:hypothetical protein